MVGIVRIELTDECGRPRPGVDYKPKLKLDGVAGLRGNDYRYVYPVDSIPNDACRWSHYDEQDVREELWHIPPGTWVYDIGSSYGSYSLAALACGAAKVFCINPNDFEQDLLWQSILLNGWADKVVQVRKGLWSRSGYLSDEDQSFRESIPEGAADFAVSTTPDGKYTQLFPVHSLDSLELEGPPALVHPEGIPVVAKVDIEGGEAEIFKGAAQFMSRVAPDYILIELHRWKNPAIAEQCIADLANLGYAMKSDRLFCTGQISHAVFVPKEYL